MFNKSVVIVINLTIGNNVIPCEESIKILGVTLDCELNMEKHVTSTCKLQGCMHAHPENK